MPGGLKHLEFKKEYFMPIDDAAKDFLVPALKASSRYDRATGYFSSTSLLNLSIGLCDLARRGGRVRVITSPKLSLEDLKSIKDGYDRRKIIENSLQREFIDVDNGIQSDRFALLAHMISQGILEMKVAVMKNIGENPNSLFHPKFGIISDEYGDSVAFTGSLNETRDGYSYNWEQMSVFGIAENRVGMYKTTFENLWEDNDESVDVFKMPQVIENLILAYRSDDVDFSLVDPIEDLKSDLPSVFFKRPDWITLRPYQKEAVEKWVENGYRGLYNMATGTGKTITALCSLERLYNDLGGGIFTIIVCPQRHIIDQWVEIIEQFDVKPIVGYSGSKIPDWKNYMRRARLRFNNQRSNECLITTNNSFSSKFIQEAIKGLRGPSVLVVDEVHNMGSEKRVEKLLPEIQYRLGLSATIDRYEDLVGTERIRDYFGEESIVYTLEEAIANNMLCNYQYYPVVCTMTDSEYERFTEINKAIDAILDDQTISKPEKEKRIRDLKIVGYRLVAGMEDKFKKLISICEDRINETHTIIYCGKARWVNEDLDTDSHEEGIRVIDRVTRLLGGHGLGMKLSRFTYEEPPHERRQIREDFQDGKVDALVAISCLDEGVDIPSIKTAIITSSSDNPKEPIQRRGRVLRKFDGKEYAEIFDLIALPRPLLNVSPGDHNNPLDLKLLSKEIRRMINFSDPSLNIEDSNELIDRILHAYSVDRQDILLLERDDYDE